MKEGDLPTIESALKSGAHPKGAPKHSVVFLVRSDVKKELERGKRKFEQGDCDGARLAYERALDLDPGCAIAYFYLGFTCHEAGDLDLAKDYYLQAIDLDNKQALFLEHLARLHFEMEEYSVCLVRFQEAQAIGPLQAISYGLMGRAHYEMDRFPEAIGCLEKMLEIEEDLRLRRIAHYYLVLSHLKDGSMIPARRRALGLLENEDGDRLIDAALADKFQAAGCLSLALAFRERSKDGSEESVERIEEIQSLLARVESHLHQVFTSDEEKLLHHIHKVSQFGADRCYRVLISLMEVPSPLVREAVITYCRKFGYPLEQPLLAACLQAEPLVKESALLYLAETFEVEYLPLMTGNLQNPSRDVQTAVARYLERCGSLEHLPALESQMEVASGAGLRRQIQRAINQIKRRHTEQTDKLIQKEVRTHKLPACAPGRSKPKWWEWILGGIVAAYLVFRLISALMV